jgi:hypothetical protein
MKSGDCRSFHLDLGESNGGRPSLNDSLNHRCFDLRIWLLWKCDYAANKSGVAFIVQQLGRESSLPLLSAM